MGRFGKLKFIIPFKNVSIIFKTLISFEGGEKFNETILILNFNPFIAPLR
jgi:hypothetical protein